MSGSKTRSQRVLVLGWGFIGAAVGDRLLAHNHSVVAFTRSETGRTRSGRDRGAEVFIGEAHDRALLERALIGVDHVLYAAGGLLPPEAAADPMSDATATLSPLIHTLEALAPIPQVALTYVSSGGAVYGNPSRTPVHETDPSLPISPYGASRLAGEIYAQTHAGALGRVVQIARCANVYGPGQPADRSQGAVAVFLSRVASGVPVSIVGDGSAVRDYVYIDNIADALTRLIYPGAETRTVNIGSGVGHTVMQVLDSVSAVVGRAPVIHHQAARSHDVRSIVLDVSKLKSLMPYAPMSLDEGLRRTWEARQIEAPGTRVGVR